MPETEFGTQQYSSRGVHRYEVVFGKDFVSTGGITTTKAICKTLGLEPGVRVLDIGSGLGGSAFHMAEAYGAQVTGVDLLEDMVGEATRRARERGLDGVQFIHGDIFETNFEPGAFDLVYSRDAILHIEEKTALFRRAYDWLVPGGRLVITDYATGTGELSDRFVEYMHGSNYRLVSLPVYGACIEQAGFEDVQVEDRTEDFMRILDDDMNLMRKESTRLEADDRAYLLDRWAMKMEFCRDGEMKWGEFLARRPV